jgi:hypothetical protein
MTQWGTALAAPGSAATNNEFGASAVVATATLANNVTGNTVNFNIAGGRGGTGGAASVSSRGLPSDSGTGTSGTPAQRSSTGGAAGNGSSAMVDNSISTGSAFASFAGLQSLNMNTGVAASQNSTVNVSVSAGGLNLTH